MERASLEGIIVVEPVWREPVIAETETNIDVWSIQVDVWWMYLGFVHHKLDLDIAKQANATHIFQ